MTEPRKEHETKTRDDLSIPINKRILVSTLVGATVAIVIFVIYSITLYPFPHPHIWHWKNEHLISIFVWICSGPMFFSIGVIGGIIGANIVIKLFFRFIKITKQRWLLVLIGAIEGGILAASLGVLFVDYILR